MSAPKPGVFSVDAPPGGSVRDWIDHHADHAPERISHSFPGTSQSFSWSSLRTAVVDLSCHIAALGVGGEESVALMLPNGPAAILALYGTLYGGFRLTPINLAAGAEAVGYALSHSGAKIVLCGDEQRALLAEALALHPANPQVIAVSSAGDVGWPEGIVLADLPEPPTATSQALLMYTSGTTGRPKGVVHSHASLLAGGWTPTVAHGLTPQDTAYCVLPHYHINGLCVTIMGPLISGGAVAVAPRFSASRFWQQAGDSDATWFSVVPTIISHLLQGDAPAPETAQRIRFGRSASAPLSPDVHDAFEKRFCIPIVETMGLTETSAQILSNPMPPGLRKIGSPGVAVGNEVRVCDGKLNEVARNTEGEVVIRGPNVMSLYLDNPEVTAETISPDGWLRTGDLGRMDEDGFVFITGRLKELIIKGGENIAPREIDDALYSHPDVIEAAAFARPCASYGETVEAAVVVREGSGLSEEALRQLCITKLGKFKSPDRIHLLDDLPKGPSGKIQRRKVGEMTQPT